MTTLNFSQKPVSLTYNGCFTKLNKVHEERTVYSAQMATVLTTGTGGSLYVTEAGSNPDGVAILDIESSTGCTTEVAISPFTDRVIGPLRSIITWPPRPF